MAKADLVLALSKASLAGDRVNIRRVVEAISSEETAKGHTSVSAQLNALLEKYSEHSPTPPQGRSGEQPGRRMEELALTDDTREALDDLTFEYKHRGLLAEHNVPARHRVLLTGAPGTGKTSVARALAQELQLPLVTAQYEQLIGSFLGETSSRFAQLLATATAEPSVLFLDEFETLAKERSDLNDAGEMKRVVSTLLLQIDALPTATVLVAATNHPELLDRAAWRRFQLTISMPTPDADARRAWVRRLAQELGLRNDSAALEAVSKAPDMAYAGVEELVLDARRRELLEPLRRGDAGPR